MQKVIFTKDNEVLIGKHKYIGKELDLDDVLNIKEYNLKVKHYPKGKFKAVMCNFKTFKLPVPGEAKFRKHDYSQFYSEDYKAKLDKEKEAQNAKRAIDAIYDIVYLNPDMNWFVTLTIDPKKINASSPEKVYDKLKNFLSNAVQLKSLKYLILSEYHKKKDRRIHLHCLMNEALELKFSKRYKVEGFKKPMGMRKIFAKGLQDRPRKEVYNVIDWKYGYSTAIKLDDDSDNVAGYVSKYISKDVENTKIFGRHYLSSKNIERYPVIELVNVPFSRYDELNVKEYDCEWNDFKYKYWDNFTRKVL